MDLTLTIDREALKEQLGNVVLAAQAAARPAAYAMAEVLYAEMRTIVAAKPESVTGNLLKGLYHAFAEQQSLPRLLKSPGYERAFYNITWSHAVAPHGHLVEDGHFLPYVVIQTDEGRWFTVKRPDAKGPKPRWDDPWEKRAAYWMTWPPGTTGPRTILKEGMRWVKPYKFVQTAFDNKADEALKAGEARFFTVVNERLEGQQK